MCMENNHYIEQRPWGSFEILSEFKVEEPGFFDSCVKKLVIKPGKRLSYQLHKQRDEHWFFVQGEGIVILNDKKIEVKVGSSVDIKDVKHIGKHRQSYFADDDRFVKHCRRYELAEMMSNLDHAGLNTVGIQKVLGPLEKITMLTVISLIRTFDRFRSKKNVVQIGNGASSSGFPVILFALLNRLYCIPVWLDARLAPRCLSSVLLIHAVKPGK